MHPIDLPQFEIQPLLGISHEFLNRGISDFHAAISYVKNLPHGRISNPHNPALVLFEKRGTCSSKHALLAKLAQEQGWNDIQLSVGMYDMDGQNTPQVSEVLEKYKISSLPETHCYLSYFGQKFHFTHRDEETEPQVSFNYEQIIQPHETGHFKKRLHKQWMKRWMNQKGLNKKMDFDALWKIHEECIDALRN